MKHPFFFTMLFIIASIPGFAQQTGSHLHQAPPLNPGHEFTRGLMVDCADEIIRDISNGSILGLDQKLIDFASQNFIGYIILRDLESSGVFSNHLSSNSLARLVRDLRRSMPAIKIGISGSTSVPLQTTPLFNTNIFSQIQFPIGSIQNLTELDQVINYPLIGSNELIRSELCKFFCQASAFGCEVPKLTEVRKTNCSFDAIYLEYRYWDQTTSLQSMQNEFENFKIILSVMRIAKSRFSNVNFVDAEFQPTDLFKLQGWTAIDQITEGDPLADRLFIPSFTPNVADVFNKVCRTFHFLSDRFSKPNTRVFLMLSAESRAFEYCNSSASPKDFLGDYLNGVTIASGNLYSVEKSFLDIFNDPNYFCQSCSCRPYADDHYNLTNLSANTLAGVIWTPYTMMKKNHLFRTAMYQHMDTSSKKLIVKWQLFDLRGKIIINAWTQSDYSDALGRLRLIREFISKRKFIRIANRRLKKYLLSSG